MRLSDPAAPERGRSRHAYPAVPPTGGGGLAPTGDPPPRGRPVQPRGSRPPRRMREPGRAPALGDPRRGPAALRGRPLAPPPAIASRDRGGLPHTLERIRYGLRVGGEKGSQARLDPNWLPPRRILQSWFACCDPSSILMSRVCWAIPHRVCRPCLVTEVQRPPATRP